MLTMGGYKLEIALFGCYSLVLLRFFLQRNLGRILEQFEDGGQDTIFKRSSACEGGWKAKKS